MPDVLRRDEFKHLRGASTRSEWPQNRKRNHPLHGEMHTSRVDGVKAPLHDGTPRSHILGRRVELPELVPEVVRVGAHVVLGQRHQDVGEVRLRVGAAHFFYRALLRSRRLQIIRDGFGGFVSCVKAATVSCLPTFYSAARRPARRRAVLGIFAPAVRHTRRQWEVASAAPGIESCCLATSGPRTSGLVHRPLLPSLSKKK